MDSGITISIISGVTAVTAGGLAATITATMKNRAEKARRLHEVEMKEREAKAAKEAVDTHMVGEATKTLIEGLLKSMRTLQDDVAALRDELRKCEEKHGAAEDQIDELRRKVKTIEDAAPTSTVNATGCTVNVVHPNASALPCPEPGHDTVSAQ